MPGLTLYMLLTSSDSSSFNWWRGEGRKRELDGQRGDGVGMYYSNTGASGAKWYICDTAMIYNDRRKCYGILVYSWINGPLQKW